MLTIVCLDKAAAMEVKRVLFAHGVSHAIKEVGPFVDDPRIRILVNQAIDSQKEPAIRRDIGRISGATIQE